MGPLENFGYRFPRHPEVTEKDRSAAIELMLDYENRAARERQEKARELTAALERGRSKLRDRLGAENYEKWKQFKQDLRIEMLKLQRPPDSQGLTPEKLLQMKTERMASFLASHGAASAEIKRIVQEVISANPLPIYTSAEGTLEFNEIGVDTTFGPSPTSGITTFMPPFAGDQFGLGFGAMNGFRGNRILLLDRNTGHVGNILTLDCDAADDFDTGSMTADAQVVFFFRAPATGLVEVVITANCGEARHFLQVLDEWGVSDCGATQLNFLMMHVLHPNVRGPSFAEVSRLNVQTDVSTRRDVQHILPGREIRVRLVSDGPVPAGATMAIRAGTRSQDGVITNDMAVHSRTTFSWFIRRVEVRIV